MKSCCGTLHARCDGCLFSELTACLLQRTTSMLSGFDYLRFVKPSAIMWKSISWERRLRPARRCNSAFQTSPDQSGPEALECRLLLSVDVLTFHNDTASTGVNSGETQLGPNNVKVGSFGKLFATPVDGQVYAQPLVQTGLTIGAGPNTTIGVDGTTHDVVFVATEHDSLYAIDGSVAGGSVLWKRSFTDLTSGQVGTQPGSNINNPQNATEIATLSSDEVGTGDISPEIGITGTPVIDPSTNTLYLVVKTREVIGGNVHYVQRLHAIDVTNGTDKTVPYLIGDTTDGNLNNTQIYCYGTGDGNVTDPYHATGQPVVQFNALREAERGALSLVDGKIYVEWASHGDNGPYHGWVAMWDISHLTTTDFELKGVLNTTPNGGLAGIWQGGGRLVFEANGSAFYFETGNGPGGHGNPVLNAQGFPVDGDYYESLVKVVADPTTNSKNQNKNGWGLKVDDYFAPYNQVDLDNADADFGSSGATLLPDSASIPGHPHLMVVSGKEGKIYLVDRDNLGKYDPNNDHVLNSIPNGSGQNTPPVQISGSLSSAAYFNGKIYWTSGYSGTANAYVINPNGTLSVTSQTSATFGYLPGSESISSNGNTAGIVWVMDRQTNRLRAYDANTFATELWDSGQKGGGADNLGSVVKFAVPTVANGEVYVGTTNSLVVYGLTPPANAVPHAPSLSATALSGTSVNLTWQDSTTSPNMATGYKVEISTDGLSFNPATTATSGATSIAIGGLSPDTKYYFRIRGFNGLGDSSDSNVADATTTNVVALIDFSAGFANAAEQLTLNGTAQVADTQLQLTDSNLFEAGSAFSTNPVDVTRFDTQFSFQLQSGTDTADGFTFTIQGVGPAALGTAGGSLGYGPDAGIGQSVAIKFDLYNNNGEGTSSTGLYTDGAAPFEAGSIDLLASNIDLHSGDPFQVTMSYDGTTLSVTILDTVTQATATQNYLIDIPGTVGSGNAYVGFTGGTGGLGLTQDIVNWTFSPSSPQAPNAPTGLGATPATATSVALNWTNNSTNQAGFHLDRATDPDFTENFITEFVAASHSGFIDSATGLAPGSTFYYRLRAFNAAGESENTNVTSVTIPLAPAKPSNAEVTSASPSELDLSWTDNAGITATGYQILRAVNHGAFEVYASLPPLHTAPPATYSWADTNVTPGDFYEYHIKAVNTSGNNDFAGTNATAVTLPPGGLVAAAGNDRIALFWSGVTGAQSYNVYRSTTAGGEDSVPLITGVLATEFTDTSALNGTKYFYTITAVNSNQHNTPVIDSESSVSAEVSAQPTSLFAAHVNFSPNLNEIPNGYLNDTGLVYATHGGALKYGWNKDNSSNLVDRNSATSPNELQDSFAEMQTRSNRNASWQIAVPNGTYQVHVIAGDPDSVTGHYKIKVQKQLVIDAVPTSDARWSENTVAVHVRNGKLKIANSHGAISNKLNAIDIIQVASPQRTLRSSNGL
ncbi:MAG: hypothetical protein JWM11_5048 [Planctomycetaceae bacterium]|nr:hypothetical protein [Planctomycetaceae bacterium]